MFLPSVPILRIKPASRQCAGFDLPLRSDPGVFQSVRKIIPEFLDCKILPEEIPEYTVGVIGSWSGERKYLSREEVGQLLSASDPKTRILAEMLRYFEGKTWIVSCADCQEAFGILADAEMREAFGLDEQEQIGPKLEM